ncbi:MAG: FHA domain-containing protein [Planctomycetes bacterium]|nr:FHA domain-containing protein [Planctomycetota bacterium]
MSIVDKVTRIEKRLEKLGARTHVVRQPVEVRRAILDDIEDLAEPAGRSRRVFPYNKITVEILAPDASRRAAMTAVLETAGGLAAAIDQRLREAGAERPADLEVLVKLVRTAGAAWEEGKPFRLVCGRRQTPRAAPPAEASARGVQAQLVVLKGEATRKQFTLTGERINIGRLAEVLDRERRVVRRNQVVFIDSQDPANQTVSRAQAHILFMPPAGFHLFDDRSTYGTRVFRGGRTIAIPSGSPKGVRLRTGDEISFGQASVRFEIKAG